MSVALENADNIFLQEEASRLWQEVCVYTKHSDDEVTVRVVDEAEIRRLNMEYRGKDAPTNVLTFSYGEGVHDIALCGAVAKQEAEEKGVTLHDYVALLLVHGFLHAVGMDHERSGEEAQQTHEAEAKILAQAGFSVAHL